MSVSKAINEETEKLKREFYEAFFTEKTPNELIQEIFVSSNGDRHMFVDNVQTALNVADDIISKENLTDEQIVNMVNKLIGVVDLAYEQYIKYVYAKYDEDDKHALSYEAYEQNPVASCYEFVDGIIFSAALIVNDDKTREELIDRLDSAEISSSEYRIIAESFKIDEYKIKYLKYALHNEEYLDDINEEEYYSITASILNSEKKLEINEYIKNYRESEKQRQAQEVQEFLRMIDEQVSGAERANGLKKLVYEVNKSEISDEGEIGND